MIDKKTSENHQPATGNKDYDQPTPGKSSQRPTRLFFRKSEKINASSQAPLQNALKIKPKGCNLGEQ